MEERGAVSNLLYRGCEIISDLDFQSRLRKLPGNNVAFCLSGEWLRPNSGSDSLPLVSLGEIKEVPGVIQRRSLDELLIWGGKPEFWFVMHAIRIRHLHEKKKKQVETSQTGSKQARAKIV